MKRRLLPLFTLFCLVISLSLSAGAVKDTGFSDVDGSNGYAEAIRWAAEQGYINGYPDGHFGVYDPVTRAQAAAIFYRAAGSPDVFGTTRFSDVQAAVDWSRSNRILAEREDGRFAPNDSATRAEVVSALYQYRNPISGGGTSHGQEGPETTADHKENIRSVYKELHADRETGC